MGRYDAAAKVAAADAAAAAEKRAKKAKLKTADAARFELAPVAVPAAGAAKVFTSDSAGCVHEVAVPPDYAYVQLSEDVAPETPAKSYPFILDPFQQEAVKCLG